MESKNKFFTFIFSFIPGAGHMYLGMMTKGTVFMSLFFGIFAILAYFGLEVFMAFLPVVWCYSFFDVLNLKHLTYEERIASEKNSKAHYVILWGTTGFFQTKDKELFWVGL